MNDTPKPKKLIDQVRDVLRVKHYAYRTEKTYILWIPDSSFFIKKNTPRKWAPSKSKSFWHI